eukprot:1140927-Pelagomonas_calceolata.AAC.3
MCGRASCALQEIVPEHPHLVSISTHCQPYPSPQQQPLLAKPHVLCSKSTRSTLTLYSSPLTASHTEMLPASSADASRCDPGDLSAMCLGARKRNGSDSAEASRCDPGDLCTMCLGASKKGGGNSAGASRFGLLNLPAMCLGDRKKDGSDSTDASRFGLLNLSAMCLGDRKKGGNDPADVSRFDLLDLCTMCLTGKRVAVIAGKYMDNQRPDEPAPF